MMTDAELLRAAAGRLRELAEAAEHSDAAEPGVWMTEHHNSQYHREPGRCHIAEDRHGVYWTVASQVYIPIAEYMATVDPFTGHRIAEWLEWSAHWWRPKRPALAVARAVMGDES